MISISLRRIVFTLVPLLLCASCAQWTYEHTGSGKFEGGVDVRWIKPDRFMYIPESDPIRFTTSSNRIIAPQRMYTDGGSVPRLFWGVPGYSPWGYAPAYIVHDWLFAAHHCDLPEYRDITFEQSATILAEGIKTLMVSKTAPMDETTLWSIYEAVRSPVAKSLWDRKNACDLPPEVAIKGAPPGELLMQIRFDQVPRR